MVSSPPAWSAPRSPRLSSWSLNRHSLPFLRLLSSNCLGLCGGPATSDLFSFPRSSSDMCPGQPILSPQNAGRSVEVQIPTLKGIRVPTLETNALLSDPSFTHPSSVSTFVPCIDAVSLTGQTHKEAVQSFGHKHSCSLEVSPDCVVVSEGSLDSAVSDSFPFLLPWSRQLDAADEVSSSSLNGLYISHSSRKKTRMVVPANSISPPLPALSSLDPVPTPTSPHFDSDGTMEDEEDENKDVWNLIPYDISWGPAYYGYRKGTLPGPDGKCIFLRSPTPLKYQRTGQACEKCRERKAKCSGSRPSCSRCTMRGLWCIYASDAKRAKSEDPSDESEMRTELLEVQPVYSRTPGHPVVQSTARVRRNTDCGSHGVLVPIRTRSAALRRRHSTIGSTCSVSNSSSVLDRQSFREPRIVEDNVGGFLGGLLDPLIAFPENGAEDDDLRISESSRLSYQTLLRNTDPVALRTTVAYSGVDAGAKDNSFANALPDCQQQYESEWNVHTLIDDDSVQRSNFLAVNSSSCDLPEERPACAGPMTRFPSQPHHSIATYDDGYAHQMLVDKHCQTYTFFAGGSEGVLNGPNTAFDYDMSDASSLSKEGRCQWSHVAAGQAKVDLMGYSMATVAPHIALPSHSPDFFHFEHEDAKAWFSLDDG